MSIEQYIAYLMSEPGSSSCIRASEVLEVSHDRVTRLLNQSHYTSYDLLTRVKEELVLVGGTLTVDDSVLDKHYTDHKKSELVGYYWSGKHHKAVKGINLIALVYTDINGLSLPVNYGLYTHLKKFGFIKVFRTVDQDESARYYAMWEPDKGETLFLDRAQFKQVKNEHWNVEKIFRLIKQTCQAERFWVRTKKAVDTHLFSVLRAAQRLLLMAKHQIIRSAYAIQRTIFIQAQKDFVTQYGQLTFS